MARWAGRRLVGVSTNQGVGRVVTRKKGRSPVNGADRERYVGASSLPGVNDGLNTAMRKRAVNGPIGCPSGNLCVTTRALSRDGRITVCPGGEGGGEQWAVGGEELVNKHCLRSRGNAGL